MLRLRIVAALLPLALVSSAVSGEGWRNGQRFDPGAKMTARAPGAPEELDQVVGYLGQWDVEVTTFGDGSGQEEPVTTKGQAEITFINRGHGFMESFYSPDVDGHQLASVYFFGFNPASGRWFLGGADSWSESAWVADGGLDEERLVFTDARRRNGGMALTHVRYTFAQPDETSLRVTTEETGEPVGPWTMVEERAYSRRSPEPDFMKPESTFGSPAPGRPGEAAEFDFLIGEWNESHQMTFPNGQEARWPSTGTGVYALNGSAIMEYSWFDLDPNLPDAATTILRLYNRAHRRWECLFVPNRGHSILYFGGVREGDDIVLTMFETDAAQARIPKFVFHDIEKDSYHWYSEQSLDRGETWTKNWVIDFERKKPPVEESAPTDG